jgi:hypothetical protein
MQGLNVIVSGECYSTVKSHFSLRMSPTAVFCAKISVKLSEFSGGSSMCLVRCVPVLITPGGVRRHPHPSSQPGVHRGHLIKHCLGVAVPVYNDMLTQHIYTNCVGVARAAKSATLATNVNNMSTGGRLPPAAAAFATAAFFALIYVICLCTAGRQFILSALIKCEQRASRSAKSTARADWLTALVADRSQSSSPLFSANWIFCL